MTESSMLHYRIKCFTLATSKLTLQRTSPRTILFSFIITEEINDTA